jgi:Putative 2OG-Fe(II) oxygenase
VRPLLPRACSISGALGAPAQRFKVCPRWCFDLHASAGTKPTRRVGSGAIARPIVVGECLERAAHDVLAFLKVADAPFHITGCWINLLDPGATHVMHSHPNNFLSGVYYLRTQSGADTINFHDPRPQTTVIRPPVTDLTAYNTDQVVLPVSEGTLLVFPAWLPHSVSANTSELARVSVSFNVMFTDYDATMSPPLWGSP